jgi:GNAT superfamily N-acetyltransferase
MSTPSEANWEGLYDALMDGDQGVIVRRATAADRDELYPLVREFATSFVPSQRGFLTGFSRLSSDPNAIVLIAVQEGSDGLTGYLLGFRHQTFFADGPVGWVEEVYTRSDKRRSGVASALMREFESWAWESGARLVALATRRANAFYESIGYESSATYFRKQPSLSDSFPSI